MKKTLLIVAAFLGLTMTSNAEEQTMGIFNHLGAGVELGTTGIGFEVGAPITDYVQVRAGFAILPSFTVKNINVNVNVSQNDWNTARLLEKTLPEERPTNLKIAGKATKTDGKLLVDVFPSKRTSFHFTVGFYAGTSEIIDVYNTNNEDVLTAIYNYNQHPAKSVGQIGLAVGDHLITPDADGVANAIVKVNAFKPYVGIGFGRVVPKKTRLAFACDMGVQFWGTPEIWMQGVKLDKNEGIKGDGGIIKTMSKIIVYPCINFRLTGRIF